MSIHWGQRLGNGVAFVTLLTAAGAIYALRFRHEPPPRGEKAAEQRSYCLGVVANNGPVVAPGDPWPALVARYEKGGRTVAPFSQCGSAGGGRATAKPGSTLMLVDSAGTPVRNLPE